MIFETIEYSVAKIDGDYAYLQNLKEEGQELKCVARALLPPEIMEGSHVIYEMLQYYMKE